MAELIDAYDTAMFDLDGVIYLGPHAIGGSAEGIAGLHERGKRVGFITNNAARAATTVSDHLTSLGIPASVDEVLTSSQAGAHLLAQHLQPGAKVLVVGTSALADEVRAVGLTVVASATDEPAAVIQGYDPNLDWSSVNEACYAIHAGAVYFATNLDRNRPTERGLVPGAGPQIDAVRSSVAVEPVTAGKPDRPLLDEAVRRWSADRPIFVGDRIDTDIIGANNVAMDSLFVFTGAHGKLDLLGAGPEGRPTYIGADMRALLAPPRVASLAGGRATCGAAEATIVGSEIRLDQPGGDLEDQLDGLWAVAQLAWAQPGLDYTQALDELDLVPAGQGQ
ncbi:HAD-IIA family hydrolase [Propionicicella superfundia]|uniref:HAD-IIA family hydrolase n=1 Tax=Propionicicella superfundia TaxID=348582 RepID=UPI0004223C84|nr:HAD-IIA family hydrolase [Propionicicella superfundia]